MPGTPGLRVWQRPLIAALAVIVPMTVTVLLLARRFDLPDVDYPSLYLALISLALLFIPFIALSSQSVIEPLRRVTGKRRWTAALMAGALLVPYLVYWALPGGMELLPLGTMLLGIGVPTLLALGMPLGRSRGVGDLLVVLSVWLPLEFRWIAPAFPWPADGTAKTIGVILGLDLLLYLMVVVRRLDGVGYIIGIRCRDLPLALGAFAVVAAVAIPFGLSTRLLAPPDGLPNPIEIVLVGFGIFLITGIPEETLFRGFFQRFLERWTASEWMGLGLASVLFGAAHLNNGPVPDWRFFTLATLAGMAYGLVYMKTRRVGPAALTHALVDVTWSVIF